MISLYYNPQYINNRIASTSFSGNIPKYALIFHYDDNSYKLVKKFDDFAHIAITLKILVD